MAEKLSAGMRRVAQPAGILWAGLLLAWGFSAGQPARAAKPSDPDVQKMVKAGVAFLHTPAANDALREREGSQILMAYAVHKVDADPKDPVVVRGIHHAQSLAGRDTRAIRNRTYANYEMAVAILLLADVNPVQYQAEIQRLSDMLLSGQRSHGGYGYYTEQQGDISQTQYVMLALWTLSKNGFDIPADVAVGVGRFFMLTQAPNGGWGYKGNVAPNLKARVPQDNRISPTLTMGGAGSLLIAGELFGHWSLAEESPTMQKLPPALKLIRAEASKIHRAAIKAGLTEEAILARVVQADRWLENPTSDFKYRDYYKMYTQERYESFLEIASGNSQPEPAWYNQGVAELRSKQAPSGGWGITDKYSMGAQHNDEPGVATAFAILYLIRSTKKSIATLSQATARGGYSIPSDTTDITMEGGQIKGKQVAGAIDGLLGLLEADDANKLDEQSIPEDLKLASDPAERRKQLDRLERLVRGSQSYLARRVAARVLGQSGELRVVPALIFALSDPDTKVKRFARDGLRFISRRFDGFGMPDKPTEQEMRAAQEAWRQWYLDLDPGYVFLDAS
ncbi:hypothetical protein [Roseimaritima sediminicola]|uniref:hypothetical protein n=1 Tax=Roseimaritima sediminicola TaxID=2662066 RepID=UPI0012982A4D|nr:hypothetical protein [Roseimaritima sediminicola]